MSEDHESALWMLDTMHHFFGLLVEDDIADFPWDPVYNGDRWDAKTGAGHFPGGLHHGMIGFVGQQLTRLAYYGVAGMKVAEEIQAAQESLEGELNDELAFWEKIAYPEPTVEVLVPARKRLE